MKPEEHELINTTKVEKDFSKELDWFYRDDCSDEIESVIRLCDRRPDNDFEKAWCELEDQDLVWMFLDLFAIDIRSMLMELVAQRRKEENESAKEQIDRINDLRGLHG